MLNFYLCQEVTALQKILSRSFFAMLGLFLADAGFPLAQWPHVIVRMLLALSIGTVVVAVLLMTYRCQSIALPVRPATISGRLKALKERIKRLKQKQLNAQFRERVSYQHERMVKKLAKAHDIQFHTTHHLKVQQNLGFLKDTGRNEK